MKRILVAEDVAEIRQALADVLELSGYEVRTTANGVEALAALASWRPDAIVLDLMMPEMDGPAFIAALWERGDEAIPVLVLSAVRDLASRAEGLPIAGAVAKPFDVEDLLSALEAPWPGAE